uniref:Glycosyltransferase family 2 protein n=1 Tax=Roseihalotalea indica TaxID=2867963 RepID=A0AA49PZJ1_9BACT|nr:glycosyltransferase family 2 protein [Tunicatimonas sp. TK19036]
MPILSIITPVFNNAQYIHACLQNVADQHCSEVEHIVVDGGSTDGTVSLIEAFAAQHPHVKWVSEKDNGQSDAMNKGIQLAKGIFIGFLNADDYYEDNVLQQVVDYIQSHDLEVPTMLLGKLRQIDYEGKELDVRTPKPITLQNTLQFWEPESYPANPVSYFYHRVLHDNIGYYDINQHYIMDYDFFIRLARDKTNIVYFNQVWGTYRMIPGAKTVEMSKKGGTRPFKEKLFFYYLRLLPLSFRISMYQQYFFQYKIHYIKRRVIGHLHDIKARYLTISHK